MYFIKGKVEVLERNQTFDSVISGKSDNSFASSNFHLPFFRTHCTLYVFITDYIKDAFLAQLHVETAGRLEQATKALDQWRTCKDPQVLKALKISRPLLQVKVTDFVKGDYNFQLDKL